MLDALKGQTTKKIYQLLEANNVYTNKLQPMDLSVNKTLKDFMKEEFNEWYSSVVYETLEAENPTPADLRMAVMKLMAIKGLQTFNGQQRNHSEWIQGCRNSRCP